MGSRRWTWGETTEYNDYGSIILSVFMSLLFYFFICLDETGGIGKIIFIIIFLMTVSIIWSLFNDARNNKITYSTVHHTYFWVFVWIIGMILMTYYL